MAIKKISLAILTPGRHGGDDIDVFTLGVDAMRKSFNAASRFTDHDLEFSSYGNKKEIAKIRKEMKDEDDSDEALAVLDLFAELSEKLDGKQKKMIDELTSCYGSFGDDWEDVLNKVVKRGGGEVFGCDDMIFPAFGATSAEARAALAVDDYDDNEVEDW